MKKSWIFSQIILKLAKITFHASIWTEKMLLNKILKFLKPFLTTLNEQYLSAAIKLTESLCTYI